MRIRAWKHWRMDRYHLYVLNDSITEFGKEMGNQGEAGADFWAICSQNAVPDFRAPVTESSAAKGQYE
jgi:hypothetical protein